MKRKKGCLASIVLLPLAATVLCSGFALIVFWPRQADALAELKSLPSYPGARLVNFSDNHRYTKFGSESWDMNGGGTWVSDEQRPLNVTTSSMTFETNDEPDSVRRFYGNNLPKSGYYEVLNWKLTVDQYMTWDDRFNLFSKVLGNENIDTPFTFHSLIITPTKGLPTGSANVGTTQVSIELTIYDETGGIR